VHLEIKKDKDFIFTLSLVEYNIKTVPDTCTVSICNNSGTAVSSGSATVSTDGTISYTFPEADNDTQDSNFSINWNAVTGSTINYYNNLFDVVLMPVNNLVNDADLFLHCNELRDMSNRIYTTTSEGSTTTLISNRFDTDSVEWKGGSICIYIDDSTTHDAKVTAYDDVSNTITFSPAYTSAIATNARFKIRSSYQRWIDEAFNNFVYRDIRNKLPYASGYLDDNALRNLTIYRTLVIIAGGEYNEEGDKWWLRLQSYTNGYNNELESLREPYDSNDDGSISDVEDDERPGFNTSTMVR